MGPFFTIVTVCLNAGNGLRKTVESVISQKFKDYEYIIKDGLSSDGSLDRLDLNSNCFVYVYYFIICIVSIRFHFLNFLVG